LIIFNKTCIKQNKLNDIQKYLYEGKKMNSKNKKNKSKSLLKFTTGALVVGTAFIGTGTIIHQNENIQDKNLIQSVSNEEKESLKITNGEVNYKEKTISLKLKVVITDETEDNRQEIKAVDLIEPNSNVAANKLTMDPVNVEGKKTGEDFKVKLHLPNYDTNYQGYKIKVKYGEESEAKEVSKKISNISIKSNITATITQNGSFDQTGTNEGLINLSATFASDNKKLNYDKSIKQVSVEGGSHITAALVDDKKNGNFKVKLSGLDVNQKYSGLKIKVEFKEARIKGNTVSLREFTPKDEKATVEVKDQFKQTSQNKGTIKLKVNIGNA